MTKLLILCVFLGVSLMEKSFELVKEPVLTTQMVEGILELAKKQARKNG
ncbi:heme-binding protein, partial [Campylobacter coli]|nr:heme-binding protein [Campylobacter coli]